MKIGNLKPYRLAINVTAVDWTEAKHLVDHLRAKASLPDNPLQMCEAAPWSVPSEPPGESFPRIDNRSPGTFELHFYLDTKTNPDELVADIDAELRDGGWMISEAYGVFAADQEKRKQEAIEDLKDLIVTCSVAFEDRPEISRRLKGILEAFK